jgi:hypothetical protein
LNIANTLPHSSEGKAVLVKHIPAEVKRILDLELGAGDVRLANLLKVEDSIYNNE